jgi:peptidoglycan/LPS O-acetylase OafA/YrhL
MKSANLPLIDNLRGIAIIGVVAVHSIYTSNSITKTSDFNFFSYSLQQGKYGVELFFFISGFLMFSIYGGSSEYHRRHYFLKRFLRIYPLWILFLVFSFISNAFLGYGGVFNVRSEGSFFHGTLGLLLIALMGLTFTLFFSSTLWNTVIPGGWSIQVEVFHYLIFPFIRKISLSKLFFIIGTVNFLTASLEVLINSLGAGKSTFVLIVDVWLRLGLYSSLSFFILGGLGSIILDTINNKFNSALQIFLSFPKSFSFFGLSLLVIPTPFGKTIEAFGFVILCLLLASNSLDMRFVSGTLGKIGRYSYFIYFAHFIFLDLLKYLILKSHLDFNFPFAQKIVFLPVFLLTLLFSAILGSISMKYIEAPILRLGISKKP